MGIQGAPLRGFKARQCLLVADQRVLDTSRGDATGDGTSVTGWHRLWLDGLYFRYKRSTRAANGCVMRCSVMMLLPRGEGSFFRGRLFWVLSGSGFWNCFGGGFWLFSASPGPGASGLRYPCVRWKKISDSGEPCSQCEITTHECACMQIQRGHGVGDVVLRGVHDGGHHAGRRRWQARLRRVRRARGRHRPLC